jgi:hypothetical protein
MKNLKTFLETVENRASKKPMIVLKIPTGTTSIEPLLNTEEKNYIQQWSVIRLLAYNASDTIKKIALGSSNDLLHIDLNNIGIRSRIDVADGFKNFQLAPLMIRITSDYMFTREQYFYSASYNHKIRNVESFVTTFMTEWEWLSKLFKTEKYHQQEMSQLEVGIRQPGLQR